MDRTKLKNYAPQARREFIQAVTDRAAFYGLTAKKIESVVERGDVAVIAGRDHPRTVAKKRKRLEDRITRHGFEQTMEALAYTWFNRLVAIRFMELHGYLDHGYRVLSHPDSKPTPEILEHAEHVELPGLKKEAVIDLKLAGNREAELYRLLLTAQCNALHAAMPFLFEEIDDETELLLPDNLLHSDSLIRKLVGAIDEADWQAVEIIGWLYQFYISEKKDQVIGKVVASEDIPAATQLFTPNWIVKYLVQNTLGRLWLTTYPQSALRQQMEYYIEPAEQAPEVQVQLKEITPTTLNPEELTLLDPACGSGHILVEAYDVFKTIYQERGYRAQDIPKLILRKNLFGLEIDDRAAQLAALALMMKARSDDRRIFDRDQVTPNILAFQESPAISAADITYAVNAPINKDDVPSEYLIDEIEEEKAGLFSKRALAEKGNVSQSDISALLGLFENAKTFGSLIQVPPTLAAALPAIEHRVNEVLKYGDLTQTAAHVIEPLLQQAKLLARRYESVVANPPYMGSRGMNDMLRGFAKEQYSESKGDLYAQFIERGLAFVARDRFLGMVAMHGWLFLSSFEKFRKRFLAEDTFLTMAHLGPRAFAEISGEVVQTAAFSASNSQLNEYRPTFFRLVDGEADQKRESLAARRNCYSAVAQDAFADIPGSPVAYWVSDNVRRKFKELDSLKDHAQTKQGLATTNNALFLRLWHEVSVNRIAFDCHSEDEAEASGCRWFPCNKGGSGRRWYGNNDYVVNYEHRGKTICDYIDSTPGVKVKSNGRVINRDFYFKPGLTWSSLSSASFAMRYVSHGFVFETKGSMCFPNDSSETWDVLSYCNSKLVDSFLSALSPTMDYHEGPLGTIPFLRLRNGLVKEIAMQLVRDAKLDWDSAETSWGFMSDPLVEARGSSRTLSAAHAAWRSTCASRLSLARSLESENNRLWIEAYGLQDELSSEVSDDQITLYRPDREEDIKRMLSYVVGCKMGRYSLDEPGLVYANGGNEGFDSNRYKSVRADDDGIVPLLEFDWGIPDDAANRVVEFIGVAWSKEDLEENLKFIAASLGQAGSEQPRDTLRRYFATAFYKHHLSQYRKRPIYWLFSSGKQRAFQCLVYVHRYNEGTLARMRTEYVIPLQGQLASRIEQLEGDKVTATSTSHRRKLQKEQDDLKKQQAELLVFEEKLKHLADQKISLDLDDGVKVNYAKFGDLLAESKAITGGTDDE